MLYKTGGEKPDLIESTRSYGFLSESLKVFQQQYTQNAIYKAFSDAIKHQPGEINTLTGIPFLPISFFKTHKITTDNSKGEALLFESSGTTGTINSKHYVLNKRVYNASILNGFNHFYGLPSDYTILALLPSYLERNNSSLVYMAKLLMEESRNPLNDFYLNDFAKLANTIQILESQGQKTLLIGVTFALLDFATQFPMQLKHTTIMETGGMKGRHEEWTRTQVHDYLKQQWQLDAIHSEYGMTEMLSQSYAKENGIFYPANTLKVLVRDINDPLEVKETGTGCLNIIDLANIYSCSFIATEDIGTVYADGSFEVLGRADHSALRGCSLMAL